MTTVLLDTNLLVYLFDSNAPVKQTQAIRVLEHLKKYDLGRLSAQNLAEFMHVSTHKLKPPLSLSEAAEQVNAFIQIFPVFDLTSLVVLEAARGARDHGLAYYDAQIWACARLNQVAVVFSEDFSDGQVLEGVRFVNPFGPAFRLEDWG
jgi:predicted nucleic acid-binding protein